MFKILFTLLICLTISSCVVSKKKYIALEQELTQIKSDLQDDDKDGVPNYVDLESNTDTLANVDSKGRTLKIIKVVDIDGDGVLDVDDFCPTIKGISAANGCPDKDGDGVYDFVDKCPNAPGLKKDGGCPVIEKGDKSICGPRGRTINFNTKSANFTQDTKSFLDNEIESISKTIIENPKYILVIEGFTDNVGDSLKNIKLSEKRAEKVRELLLKKGVSMNQVQIIGKGRAEPRESNDTKKGREANNRVGFIVKFEE